MSWLTEVVRPRIRSWLGQEIRDVPENLWRQCPACQQMIFHKDLDANLKVCPPLRAPHAANGPGAAGLDLR